MYACVWADVCVWVCQYTYTVAKGESQVLCFITLDLLPLRQNPLLSWLLGIKRAPVVLLPVPPKVLVFQAYMAMPTLLSEFCGSQPGIPCLCSKSSQPMGHFTSSQKEKNNCETKNLQVEFQRGQRGGSKHLPTIYLYSKQFNSRTWGKNWAEISSSQQEKPMSGRCHAFCTACCWVWWVHLERGPHLAGLLQILSKD